MLTEIANAGVCKSRSHTAQETCERCKQISIRKGWFDNKKCADKCPRNRHYVEYLQLFAQKNKREQHTEKRRHLVEDRCVRKHKYINGVKVAYHAQRTCQRPCKQHKRVFPRRTAKSYVLFLHYSQREKQRHKVSEKYLLHRRQVARKPYKCKHKRKAERRQDYQQYSLVSLIQPYRPLS